VKPIRWLAVIVLLAVVVGSGGYAVAQARSPKAAYRTATATLADVEHTLDLSGTVAATGRRDLGFGTSGTVSRVGVKAGQRVRKGQVIARLDSTSLVAAVTSAVATFTKAEAQLASDEAAQATAVSASTSSGSSGSTGSTKKAAQSGNGSGSGKQSTQGSSTGSTPSTTKPDPALQQALSALAVQQQAVTTAQSDATDAITAAKAALASQTQTCQQATSGSASGSDTGSTDPGSTDPDGLASACTTALATVQDAQDTVAVQQDALQTALTDLAGTLSKAVAAVTKATQTQTQTQTQQHSTPTASSSQTGSTHSSAATTAPTASGGGSTSSSGGTVTAAHLAKDQADIDTAQADLREARSARALATLRAPYAGRVLEVGLAHGDQVSSSETPVVLVGHGVTTVTTSVTTAQVPDVRRGQAATVTPAGWSTPMKGTVTSIALLPDSTGDFAVTVTVASTRTVSEGSTAAVALVVGTARDAVTVPTSALTRVGTRSVVSVLHGQSVTRTLVTVGVVGTRRTSITQGLTAGAKVVLADLDAAVPTSTTNTTQRRFQNAGGTGGFGGGQNLGFRSP
jgi:HlyD family secretion protein